jgi:tetratricopeptide (TPR) repeat protein
MNSIAKILLPLLFLLNITVEAQTSKSDSLQKVNPIAFYQDILKRNKKSAYANYGLAYAYYLNNDFQKAIKYSKRNIKNTSDYQAGSYLVYSSSLDALGRTKKAIDLLEEAIKLYPSNAQLYYNHALSCYKYRDLSKAITSLDSSISKAPLYVPAHYLLACALYEKSNDPQCLSPLLFGITLDNDSSRTTQALIIFKTLNDHKHEKISIPFFEDRVRIVDISQVLDFYITKRTVNEAIALFDANDFASKIQQYILKASEESTSRNKYSKTYASFFKSIKSSGNTDSFSWYQLRYMNKPEVKSWYKSNPKKILNFSSFLEKYLPE